MDLGKIVMGIALVILSAGMLISPSGATICDCSCTVGCGSGPTNPDAMVTPYSPPERENIPGCLAPVSGIASHERAP